MKLIWDNLITPVQTTTHDLVIRTATTQRVQNMIMSLQMKHPREAVAIQQGWAAAAGDAITESVQKSTASIMPELLLMRFVVKGRVILFVLIWGIVLNGSRRGKLLQGEFRCVIVEAEEVEETLDRVFRFEHLLKDDECRVVLA